MTSYSGGCKKGQDYTESCFNLHTLLIYFSLSDMYLFIFSNTPSLGKWGVVLLLLRPRSAWQMSGICYRQNWQCMVTHMETSAVVLTTGCHAGICWTKKQSSLFQKGVDVPVTNNWCIRNTMLLPFRWNPEGVFGNLEMITVVTQHLRETVVFYIVELYCKEKVLYTMNITLTSC